MTMREKEEAARVWAHAFGFDLDELRARMRPCPAVQACHEMVDAAIERALQEIKQAA